MLIPVEFFEDWPLYSPLKYWESIQCDLANIIPTFNAQCVRCGVERTFGGHTVSHDNSTPRANTGANLTDGAVVEVRSVCGGCLLATHHTLIHFRPDRETIQKVGQFPPPSIRIAAPLERALGSFAARYRHGLICEKQGFGIGAFAYYRRIVEGVIDELLSSVVDLVPDDEKEKYEGALAKARNSRVAQDKIDLVKDILPPSLRPGGVNPLGVLHHALSEGLHAMEDQECLRLSGQIRAALEFLMTEVIEAKRSKAAFTEAMRKLLDKKAAAGGD
jgi:hypothetical protein